MENNLKGKEFTSSEPSEISIWYQDETGASAPIEEQLEKAKVHLIFCSGEDIQIEFSLFYQRNLQPGRFFIIYNPDQGLDFKLHTQPKSKVVWLKVGLHRIHELFVPEVDQAPVFNPENENRKYYEEKEISTQLGWVLNQIFEIQLVQNSKRLFLQAKAFEILSLAFSENNPDIENCPFLNNETIVRKIRQGKEILLNRFKDPPTIPELCKQIKLNEFQFKAGFKEMYGKTPYQFLLNYKLEIAKQLLVGGKHLVHETADYIGYSNISHFIGSFKKKFGVTPKKLLIEMAKK
ncbi:MAG: AraC family transcriptional regulator [Bacteroidota bacterium]|nr:AraC family transcriptional regulator [Bacteroidota bacterium]